MPHTTLNHKEFAKRLRLFLSTNKISQVRFAKLLSITPNHLNKVLVGRQQPNLELVIKILNTLGMKLEFFCKEEK